jgi:hypothetical protein
MRYGMALALVIGTCIGSVGVKSASEPPFQRMPDRKSKTGHGSPCAKVREERRALENSTESEIQQWKTQGDDSVAICACWEEIRRKLPKRDEGVVVVDPKMAVPVHGVPGFLGFVEGRLRVPLPQWWAAELSDARAYNCDSLVLFRAYPHKRGLRRLAPSFGIVPEVAREGKDEVVVAWDKRRLRLALKSGPFDSIDAFCGLVVGERCLVAQYHFVSANPFELRCYDTASGRMIWSSKVWCGCSMTGGASGPLSHDVELVFRDGIIFVFGMEERAAYIEGFSVSEGRNVLRFSTTY